MDVGNEIGQKMRSAIKAKLTELGCYVDDELPDYVMVMVANKRTRVQMEDDLQLFLGNNTELFVNWLHQVLKKLQEVTVTAPVLKTVEVKSKEIPTTVLRSDSKERKTKEKKSKQKKSDLKKSKKKDKEKSSRKKEDKKSHKTKKKSKHHDIIRPNIPPLLMNMEKDSEPSITDVFAGQILKNHGITLDPPKDNLTQEKKVVIKDVKRPILPIIDPATISAQIEPENDKTTVTSNDPNEDQIKEINQIEAKIQGLKQKLVEQLDSISDDEDFLNIRTEAEELMNDFAEDVFQEVSEDTPVVATPPLVQHTLPVITKPIEVSKEPVKDLTETLPQIELKLPKRPLRDRLGAREESRTSEVKEKERTKSPERFTPDRELEPHHQKSAKSRLGSQSDTFKKSIATDDPDSDKSTEYGSKKLTSKVSLLENRRSRSSCASVVRVRPRLRGSAPASSLLLRAVADAHKSLLNTPNTKTDLEQQQVKHALVLPMRRCVDAQKIVIEVPTDNSLDALDSISLEGDLDSGDEKTTKVDSILDKDKYVPTSITKRIVNEYVPTKHSDLRTTTKKDDSLVIETINIHAAGSADKKTQFIVTMDGYHPNAFLAKKLQTEGLLEDEDIDKILKDKSKPLEKEPSTEQKEPDSSTAIEIENKKRLSSTSEESATQVVIKKEEKEDEKKVKDVNDRITLAPKRKASPIVFDVDKRLKTDKLVEANVRERTESVSSDHSHVTVTTVTNTHKYDAVPPLKAMERKIIWCRAFPACRYGVSCAYTHPRCKFLAACTRRNCVYSHSPDAPTASGPVLPSVASHVVPVVNYKTISSVVPNMCKFYPHCVNPSCHFYHPKPCRYGNNCANKLECNFFHADIPSKWKYNV